MQALIGLGLCLFMALGIQTFRIGALKEEAAQKDAAISKAQLEAAEKARALEQQYADNVRKASDAYQANLSRAQAGAASARSQLDGLRDTLAAAGPVPADSAAASRADEAARTRHVLGQCFATVQALAATSDDLEARLVGLQDYVRGITK